VVGWGERDFHAFIDIVQKLYKMQHLSFAAFTRIARVLPYLLRV
jgi:hypothetical protein